MAKSDVIGVSEWSPKWSKSGKVVPWTHLGRGSETEWRQLLKNVSFLGWPTSLKHSKYKLKLMFFSLALTQLMAPFSIKFEAIWLAIWIPKWSRASKIRLSNNCKKTLKIRSEIDSKMRPHKVSFFMIFGTPGRYGAKWVPEGGQRALWEAFDPPLAPIWAPLAPF